MNNPSKEILGSWIAAIGTISSAIGSTPSHFIDSDLRNNLNVWGNVLQATGNALEADGQGGVSLEKFGNEIQSVGNVTVVSGLISNFEKETEQRLIISGNWIQALGGLVSLADELEDPTASGQLYNIIGNLLQSIGNSLQAIAGIYELENNHVENKGYKIHENPESLEVSGSWIQAIGSVISLIGQIKEEDNEN
ncbi:hypothetical protein [Bacillus sp. CECT 9360]|uniref:DUF6944 family repetitive protein n=1 Tax=Bacillus sp. CECT 9360 TaxID=2845821 RepID=UPI001E4B5760|nr:hypothetical protein [Bacillus sp. CECT 9360]CAH0344144.1 hypothetical protein BCI9360_00375 [Bacillus sp. CECT 9360]